MKDTKVHATTRRKNKRISIQEGMMRAKRTHQSSTCNGFNYAIYTFKSMWKLPLETPIH